MKDFAQELLARTVAEPYRVKTIEHLRVPDRVEGTMRLGRFGLKATEPSIRQQIASAMHEDLGVTSSVWRASALGASITPITPSTRAPWVTTMVVRPSAWS